MQRAPPSISDFVDIVDFLKSHYEWRKHMNPVFSYGKWQLELGLGSRTILRFILNRKRRISPKTATVFKSNLALSLKDSEYFDILLSYTQAKSQVERKTLGARLLRLQRSQYQPLNLQAHLITDDVFKPIILALMTYKDITFTNENLAQLLDLNVERVKGIISSLVEQKIILINSSGDYTFPVEGFKVGDSLGSSSLKDFYRYWLDRAKDALELPVETRRYRALEFALSSAEFLEIQEQISEFVVQVLGKYKSTSLVGRRLYMLESILMPISQEAKAESA